MEEEVDVVWGFFDERIGDDGDHRGEDGFLGLMSERESVL